jgi:hypothetical protein
MQKDTTDMLQQVLCSQVIIVSWTRSSLIVAFGELLGTMEAARGI